MMEADVAAADLLAIRPPRPEDRAQWQPLWDGYLRFYRTRLDPPTGVLGGALMGKVRDGIETGVKENLKTARERLATAR